MNKSTEYHHASLEWEEKIDAWLIDMEMLTTCDLFDPLCFKKIVYDHMATALCKDIDIILESARRLAIIGVDYRQSFYVIRAVEKLTIDWEYRVPFLKILETLITAMMSYNASPQGAMDIAVILAKSFKTNSDSLNEEIYYLKYFLPMSRFVGISLEGIISEYSNLILTEGNPNKAAIEIRRKCFKIAKEMEAAAVKIGIISKIKRAVVNRIQYFVDYFI
ncbi:MAG TPA: hypothetical protein ENI07_17245, partial [Desulfobacterales bacterium]|nr:hypothetical protein [Desulfobacterales bacterium]